LRVFGGNFGKGREHVGDVTAGEESGEGDNAGVRIGNSVDLAIANINILITHKNFERKNLAVPRNLVGRGNDSVLVEEEGFSIHLESFMADFVIRENIYNVGSEDGEVIGFLFSIFEVIDVLNRSQGVGNPLLGLPTLGFNVGNHRGGPAFRGAIRAKNLFCNNFLIHLSLNALKVFLDLLFRGGDDVGLVASQFIFNFLRVRENTLRERFKEFD
jgi:hypothetical protein